MSAETEEPGHDAARSDRRDDAASGEGSGVSSPNAGKAQEGSGTGRHSGAGPDARATGPSPVSERTAVNLYPEGNWRREVPVKNEEATPWRLPSMRDYARVMHSASFRRLGGKTQVFPINESDFFRTRLTHSLEIAQIAEGIAQYLNTKPEFSNNPIDTRLCSTAALVHDLGHPPFGHNGERALDDSMRRFGGFEGNAQTIRIITRLEKKARKHSSISCSRDEYCESDDRAGLALTYRTILSALKYDHIIKGLRDESDDLEKGYYATERLLIERAKEAVDPNWRSVDKFKTIECMIMDIADDIAYSTYDLEDSLKAGFVTPADIFASHENLFSKVAQKANKAIKDKSEHLSAVDAQDVFLKVFPFFNDDPEKQPKLNADSFVHVYRGMRNISIDGYDRTRISSALVNESISSIEYEYNVSAPWLTIVRLSLPILKRVEVLKHFTFQSVIYSARVKVGEYRGYEVVKNIFDALADPKGELLMPEDLRNHYRDCEHDATARHRAICDFVAGMTDRYALEFHARLHSDDPQSIFKTI